MEQNDRYETRFRDVVGAYKNVLKEKTALEATVSALSSGGEEGGGGGGGGDGEGGGGDEGDRAPGEGKLVDGTALKSKVATLAKALATLTEEKASNEARFQADKKKVADNHRLKVQQIEDEAASEISSLKDKLANAEAERDRSKSSAKQYKEQLKAAHKSEKVRAEEWERERRKLREDADSQRQKKADGKTSDRFAHLESQLREARDSELDALTQLSAQRADLNETIEGLEDRLSSAAKDLAAAQGQGDGDLVLRLKQELRSAQNAAAKHKSQAMLASQKQMETVRDAQAQIEGKELQIAELKQGKNETVAEESKAKMVQESRIAEMSALVSRYEASRAQDSDELRQLREENAELLERLGDDSGPQRDYSTEDQSSRVSSLEHTVAKLKAMLHTANQRLSDVHATELPAGSDNIAPPPWGLHADETDDVSLLSPEIKQVREVANNFYKQLCEVSALKVDVLKKCEGELAEKLQVMKELERVRRQGATAIAAAQKSFDEEYRAARTSWQAQKEQFESSHETAMADLSKRTQKVRDRTLEEMAERDSEIARLRAQLGIGASAEQQRASRQMAGGAPLQRQTSSLTNAKDMPEVDELRASGPLIHNAVEKVCVCARARVRLTPLGWTICACCHVRGGREGHAL